MDIANWLPLSTILLLGAFHGINPGMGWLLAAALGIQERRQSAVWQALIPLALGHGLAISAAVLVAVTAGVAAPAASLKLPVAVTLTAFGVYRLVRYKHCTGSGTRVGMRGLTVWSFLMATCHGAGLMVLPAFFGMNAAAQGASCHVAGASLTTAATALTATLVHAGGYLIATAASAWVAFAKLGVGSSRHGRLSLDLIWAVALIATGTLTAVF